MKQQEPMLEQRTRSRFLFVLFLALQFAIVFFSFRSYINTIESTLYFSEALVLLCSLFTTINYLLFVFLAKKSFDRYFYISIFSFSYFSVFGTAALLKQRFDVTAIFGIIFLLSALIDLHFALKNKWP